MAKDKNRARPITGLGGGHREYIINGVNYVVSGKFAEPTFTDKDKTLADIVEDIINNDFTQLPIEEDEDKIKTKPVRSTAGKER